MSRHYVLSPPPPPRTSFRTMQAESIQRVNRTMRIDGVDYEVVFDGGEGLTSPHCGSTLKAAVGVLAVGAMD